MKILEEITDTGLLEEIKLSQATGKVTDQLVNMFWTMAKRVVQKPSFAQHLHQDDMLGEALYNCTKVVMNYKLSHENPLSYFHAIVTSSCIHVMHREKHQFLIQEDLGE